MQYCKNCGRQLKEGTRFCERCGRSVRQSASESSRRQQIEELQRERIARKQRRDQREVFEEKRRQRRMEQLRKRKKLIITVSAAAAAFVLIACIAFCSTPKGSNSGGSGNIRETLPTENPSSRAEIVAETTNKAPGGNESDYKELDLSNGMTIQYPREFESASSKGSAAAKLSDSSGDAVMIVMDEEFPGGTISSLQKKFEDAHDGDVTFELSGGERWYSITIEEKDTTIHRKYIIDMANDRSLYYDFEYDSDSDYAEAYEKYIDHIDKNFAIEK